MVSWRKINRVMWPSW